LAIDSNVILKAIIQYAQVEALAAKLLPRRKVKHLHHWILRHKGPALDYRILKVRDLVEIEESAEKALTTIIARLE